LPPAFPDKSGIGVHYVDAFLAVMSVTLPGDVRVSCKRRGLRISLRVGPKKGDGIMRRLEVSADPVEMLRAAPRPVPNLAEHPARPPGRARRPGGGSPRGPASPAAWPGSSSSPCCSPASSP
jgi:hypothetical protein